MEDNKREETLRTRQEILNLLKECKWALVREKYSEAGEKVKRISELLRLISAIAI